MADPKILVSISVRGAELVANSPFGIAPILATLIKIYIIAEIIIP